MEANQMQNLEIYNNLRHVPDNAKKPITGGRLKGKTDINPMWRIKALTEQFGACGFGWKYEIVSQKLEEVANGEVAAFVNINLYICKDGKWSEAIPGTGGNMFVAQEKNGMYTSDECFKMALTDALSVACKSLGVGADVYWEQDKTKYDTPKHDNLNTISDAQAKRIFALSQGSNELVKNIINKYSYSATKDISIHDYNEICNEIEQKINSK
jgi:hypothetical protein